MRLWAWTVMLLVNAVAGLSYPWMKIALEGLPAGTVTLLRNFIALACLLLWAPGSKRESQAFTRSEHMRVALLGLMAYAAPLLLGIYGVRWSTGQNGSILILLEPVSIALFARLLLGESVRPLQVLGIFLGLVGAFWIVGEETSLEGLMAREHLWGNAVLALHGVLWGLFTPLAKPLVARHSPSRINLLAMLWALLLMVPAAGVEVGEWHTGPHLAEALFWTLILGVVVSYGCTVLWTWCLGHLRAGEVAGAVFVQPLAGVLGGTWLLDEHLTSDAWIGAVVIACGVVFVILGVRSARRPSAGPAPPPAGG